MEQRRRLGDASAEGDDAFEARTLYDKLERIILPLFHRQPLGYAEVMRGAIAHTVPSSTRGAWAVLFRDLGWRGLIEIGIFLGTLVVGLYYAWKERRAVLVLTDPARASMSLAHTPRRPREWIPA